MFKEGTTCNECGKLLTREYWIKCLGKYFCSWKCQGIFENEHKNDKLPILKWKKRKIILDDDDDDDDIIEDIEIENNDDIIEGEDIGNNILKLKRNNRKRSKKSKVKSRSKKSKLKRRKTRTRRVKR
jgi:hypothetical protein